MRAVKVKICGIMKKHDVKMVASMGADAIGFVVGVPTSQRNLSLEKAEHLIQLVPLFVTSVLVTVPNNTKEVLKICQRLHPDALQIYGETLLNLDLLRENFPNITLIKAINVNPNNYFEKAIDASRAYDAVHLDSYVPEQYGGTGIVHNWELSKNVKEVIHPTPLILAGGLTPENVQKAVKFVQPFAVDVATGVEKKPGIKDPEKVFTFIKNAKQAMMNNT